MSRFDFLIDKLNEAPFVETPFRHLHIEDLLPDDLFEELIKAPELALPPAANDDDLFDKLFDAGYKIVQFPGCTTDKKAYINWHASRNVDTRFHSACEGFGITLRLYSVKTDIVRDLQEFLSSEKFNRALAKKFDVPFEQCNVDNGIQKYLDGYEISPHPDIRRKAVTFMVNINPHERSEEYDHHTHYLTFRPDWRHVQQFWENNPDVDRCWVPWDWCETQKRQTRNNSLVAFSPSCDTLHAVKATYDHLSAQRTQLYGNLWYSETPELGQMEWEDLAGRSRRKKLSARKMIARALPVSAKRAIKRALGRERDTEVAIRKF